MATDLNSNTAAWAGDMFPDPRVAFNYNVLNKQVTNSGFLCRQWQSALSGLVRLDNVADTDGTIRSKLLLQAGTYLFQISWYSNDGGSSIGTFYLNDDDTVNVALTVRIRGDTAPTSGTGSYVLVIDGDGYYFVTYKGTRTAAVATEHQIFVAYRPLLQDL